MDMPLLLSHAFIVAELDWVQSVMYTRYQGPRTRWISLVRYQTTFWRRSHAAIRRYSHSSINTLQPSINSRTPRKRAEVCQPMSASNTGHTRPQTSPSSPAVIGGVVCVAQSLSSPTVRLPNSILKFLDADSGDLQLWFTPPMQLCRISNPLRLSETGSQSWKLRHQRAQRTWADKKNFAKLCQPLVYSG